MLRHTLKRPNSLIEDSWLELGNLDGIEINNPLLGRSKDELENPGLLELRTMRNPEYLSFAAKTLLNVDLHPVQAMIMQELWTKPFPMYLASRGFGKVLPSDEKIRVKDGWVKIKDVQVGDKVYGGDGKLCNVTDKTDLQENVVMYKITLRDGRQIDCCEDHQWKVYNKSGRTENISTKEIVKRMSRSNPFYLPINKEIDDGEKDHKIHPYVLGYLIGDGCLTGSTPCMSFYPPDKEWIIQKVKDCIDDKNLKISYASECSVYLSNANWIIKEIRDLGLNVVGSEKFIPDNYRFASVKQKRDLLAGLLDSDGSVCINKPCATSSRNTSIIVYTTTSPTLANDIQDLVRSLGYICSCVVSNNDRYGVPSKTRFDIKIRTDDKIFGLDRKNHKICKRRYGKQKRIAIKSIEKIDNADGYCIMVDSPDHTYITKDYIVTHNSFLGAVYISLKCALCPGTKAVVVGAAFRQSKIIWQYMKDIWENAPVLRSVCDNNSGARSSIDRCVMTINNSVALFLPLGNGDKIRGARANLIWADEFSSIDPNIFETVVRGFAAVSQKPIDKVRAMAKKKAMLSMGADIKEIQQSGVLTNQCVISGTADYDFMHFADYWRRYYVYINSKGDESKPVSLPNGETRYLRDYFPEGVKKSFDYRDYTIMRIPFELIPEGYMDEKIVSEAKANSTKSSYLREYGAVFPSDSDGFFKRSLIQSCVGTDINPVRLNGNEIYFDASTIGLPGRKYVFGIDPAAESDNFAIVILEVWPDHNRVVFSWSTNVSDFQKRRISGLVEDHDYYSFCARKIRNLMKAFPTDDIALDAQGGGRSILEALHDPYNLKDGESLIWPTNRIMAPEKELDTDHEGGLHIVHLCQFANADFTSGANHGTRKDLEDKTLLFPRFDPVTLELANQKDVAIAKRMGVDIVYDTLEDCAIEIEALKDELCTIVMTRTTHGNRDRWDTPETTTAEGKKTRMRKDRYSALIMANYIARSIKRAPEAVTYDTLGGFAHQLNSRNKAGKRNGPLYTGPAWYTNSIETQKYRAVKKKG